MRYILNTTFHLDASIEKAWVVFLTKEQFPLLKTENLCSDILFTRVRVEEEEESPAYSLQLVFETKNQYHCFRERHHEPFLKTLASCFPGRFVYFCTTLEEVLPYEF